MTGLILRNVATTPFLFAKFQAYIFFFFSSSFLFFPSYYHLSPNRSITNLKSGDSLLVIRSLISVDPRVDDVGNLLDMIVVFSVMNTIMNFESNLWWYMCDDQLFHMVCFKYCSKFYCTKEIVYKKFQNWKLLFIWFLYMFEQYFIYNFNSMNFLVLIIQTRYFLFYLFQITILKY